MAGAAADKPDFSSTENLSYKFQRLRERLRTAVETGELTGKLPGERVLAKRFQVNAKTLSKALTDLAAEGVLDRCIGRGTFVRGQAPSGDPNGRWLVLADPTTGSELIDDLRQHNENLQIWTDPVENIRPSLINQFCAVIDLARETPEAFLRDLVVRNIPVIAVGHEPKTYSMHAVVVDRLLGASRMARNLMLAGHRKLAVLTGNGENGFIEAVRQTARRFDAEATVDPVSIADLPSALRGGVTGIVCDTSDLARQAAGLLAREGSDSPVSLLAVGTTEGGMACSGHYVSTEKLAGAVHDLLTGPQASRPTVLWLAGQFIERDSTPSGAAHNPNEATYRRHNPPTTSA